MKQVCFGVDIGGTAVKAGMFDREGNLLKKWAFATQRTGDGKDILKDSAHFIKGILEETKLTPEQVLGIGVGVPGPVMENGEVLLLPNLGLAHFNIETEMESLLGLKVKAGNDANNAALGELWKGGGKGCRNMVLVTLGTGVGGGIILNGSILYGSIGAAGEIGHILVNPDEELYCGCGKRGCLEQYASATGIVRLAVNLMKHTEKPSAMRSITELTAKAVLDCAKTGDDLALEAVDSSCRYLGLALSHIAHVIDPEVFVIGGGVSKAGEIITRTTEKYYNEMVIDALKNKEFRLAVLGNDAGIYGAAKLILTYDSNK